MASPVALRPIFDFVGVLGDARATPFFALLTG